ncbi:MAG: hypothetical protein RL007_2603, partial [Bacteroidota bacterium]
CTFFVRTVADICVDIEVQNYKLFSVCVVKFIMKKRETSIRRSTLEDVIKLKLTFRKLLRGGAANVESKSM